MPVCIFLFALQDCVDLFIYVQPSYILLALSTSDEESGKVISSQLNGDVLRETDKDVDQEENRLAVWAWDMIKNCFKSERYLNTQL